MVNVYKTCRRRVIWAYVVHVWDSMHCSENNKCACWTCSNCFAERCWPVRTKCYRCGKPRGDALLPPRKGKGRGKGERPQGPLGRQPPAPDGAVPPTVSDRQPQVLPPRGPPGAGVGSPHVQEAPPSEDMVKALKLFQSVMTPEDFSKKEKKLVVPPRKEERVKLREQGLFETVQREKIGKTGAKAPGTDPKTSAQSGSAKNDACGCAAKVGGCARQCQCGLWFRRLRVLPPLPAPR